MTVLFCEKSHHATPEGRGGGAPPYMGCIGMCAGYIPLTNRVRGPYCKLRTKFFPPRFMAKARSAQAINGRRKKRGSVTYSTHRENEVSKIFIVSLLCV